MPLTTPHGIEHSHGCCRWQCTSPSLMPKVRRRRRRTDMKVKKWVIPIGKPEEEVDIEERVGG